MQRYLLFDAGCAACTKVAENVEREAGGWLTVRGLNDPEMRQILDQHRPGWAFRPTLVLVDNEDVRVFTGLALSIRIARALGVRRAARVARLVAGSELPADRASGGRSRRSVLKGVGAGVAALAGLGLFPKAASAGASGDGQLLQGDDLAEALRRVRGDQGYRDLVADVRSRGFATNRPEVVAFRGADGATLALSFFASRTAGDTTAALVAHEISADGSTSTISELITRDAATLASSAELNPDSLTVTRIGSSQPQPYGPAEYFACMLGCVGVTCAGPAANCSRIPQLAAALACIVAVCGFRAYRCHSTCRHAW